MPAAATACVAEAGAVRGYYPLGVCSRLALEPVTWSLTDLAARLMELSSGEINIPLSDYAQML